MSESTKKKSKKKINKRKSSTNLSHDQIANLKIFLFKSIITFIVAYLMISMLISKINVSIDDFTSKLDKFNTEIKSDLSFEKILKEISVAAQHPIDKDVKDKLILDLRMIKEDIKPILNALNE